MEIHPDKCVLAYFLEKSEPYINWKYVLISKALSKNYFEKWVAYLLISSSDQANYSTFKMGLSPSFIWKIINIQRTSWYQYMP